jgi:hypothetical protein
VEGGLLCANRGGGAERVVRHALVTEGGERERFLAYTAGNQTTWLAKHPRTRSTCAVHGSEVGVRADWAPLFDKYSVDLVINGHN